MFQASKNFMTIRPSTIGATEMKYRVFLIVIKKKKIQNRAFVTYLIFFFLNKQINLKLLRNKSKIAKLCNTKFSISFPSNSYRGNLRSKSISRRYLKMSPAIYSHLKYLFIIINVDKMFLANLRAHMSVAVVVTGYQSSSLVVRRCNGFAHNTAGAAVRVTLSPRRLSRSYFVIVIFYRLSRFVRNTLKKSNNISFVRPLLS
ncbi:hypothetical protein AGLY_011308 [Aphis glycines]|uniref:Uncharacterized protein n=1 Tax=Aphis glycines TaxID=307491 RepID=A0A6G0TD29_APHGL|nr:hypothetical protein AGLY_011308 [Aphis glycines]